MCNVLFDFFLFVLIISYFNDTNLLYYFNDTNDGWYYSSGQYVYIFMYTANNKRGSVHTLQIAWNKVLEQSPVVYH